MKAWLASVGKWFLAQSLAVRSLIVVVGAAVVVTAGAAGYLCLRQEEPQDAVNEVANVSDEVPVVEPQVTPETPETSVKEPEETGENLDEDIEENDTEEVEEEEEPEEEPYVKTSDKLVNGNFADGINGFEVYSFISGDISYTADAKSGFSIDIADTGEEDWHVQLKQGGIKLEQGKWYQITLDAKSSLNRSIVCLMQRDGSSDDNWMSYSGTKNLALKKQWNTYTIIFQMTEKTDRNAVFNLSMGTVDGNRIRTEHTVGIRNIKLEKLDDSWLDQLTQGDNLLKNGNFAYGDILWQASVVAPGAAKTSFEDGKAVFDISNVGTIDWHVQLKQNGIRLEQGNGYRLTFKASSSVARAINVGFMDKDYVNWYGGGLVTVGAEQTVTVEFYMDKATDTDVCMFLSMGKIENVDTPASVITLSDFSLVKVPGMVPTSSNGGGGGGGVNPITNLTDGWFVYDHNDRQVGSCYVDGDNGFRMDIANTGTEEWHVQLQKKNLLLEKDKWYRITLDAKSTLARDMGIALQRDGAADEIWTVYSGGDTASLTGEWQTFTKEFKMTSETDPATIYCISLGSVGGKQITQAHTVWIRNLKLEEIEEPKKDSIALNTEMLDKNAWGNNVDASAGATVTYADGKAVFNITDVGTESHHVQFSQSGLMLEKGCKYEFTFRATSTEARTISVGFLGGDRDWKWYGGDDIKISPVSSKARSAEDGFWRVEFTMKEETDLNATLAISLGMIKNSGAEIPKTSHTVTLSDFSLKKIAEAGETPEPGPSEDGVIYINSTDPQKTDEWGSKWVVEFDRDKYYPDIEQGAKVRITAKVYSEKDFTGMMGACRTNDWAWVDTGEKKVSAGEATWTLDVDDFMGAAQIQINSMEGDCVEIRSVKVEVVTGTEEPDPGQEDGVIYVKSTDEKNTEDGSTKWLVKIDHTKYCPEIKEGKDKVKITVETYSEKPFTVMLGACGKDDWSAWYDTGVKDAPAGESTWTLTADEFKGGAQIQIYSMEADCVEIRSIKVEVVTGTEEPDPGPEDGVIYVNASDVESNPWKKDLDPAEYGIAEGDNIRITVEMYSEDTFAGLLGAVSASGWTDQWHDSPKGESTWTLEVEDFKEGAQIQIHSMEGDCVEIRSIKVEVLKDTPEDGVIYVNASDVESDPWKKDLDPAEYGIAEGDNIRITVEMYSEDTFAGLLGAVSASGWTDQWHDSPKGESTWTLEVEDFKEGAQIQIHSMAGDCVEVRSIKVEVVKDMPEEPEPADGVILVKKEDLNEENKWIKVFTAQELEANHIAAGDKIRITAEVYSEDSFSVLIGAGLTSDPWWANGWWDVSAKEVKKCTWETEGYGTKVEIQIHNMAGDCVEIRSIKIEAISDTARMANEPEESNTNIIESDDALVPEPAKAKKSQHRTKPTDGDKEINDIEADSASDEDAEDMASVSGGDAR